MRPSEGTESARRLLHLPDFEAMEARQIEEDEDEPEDFDPLEIKQSRINRTKKRWQR